MRPQQDPTAPEDAIVFVAFGARISNPFRCEMLTEHCTPRYYGFEVRIDGDGNEGYVKRLPDGATILLTNMNGDELPDEEDCLIGLYDAAGECIRIQWLEYQT